VLPFGAPGPRPEPPVLKHPTSRGAATRPLLERPGPGRVLWARPDRAWLRLPDGVVGLAPPAAPLGPRWVNRPEPWPALAEGDAVVVDRDGLRTGDGALFLDRSHAVGWLGPLPDHGVASAAGPRALITEALAACRTSTLRTEPWSATIEPAVEAIGRLEPLDALRVVARALGGLGPGLTPAGDDALSGILFAFRVMGGPAVEPALSAVARSVRTSDLGAAVVEAAAGGFHIEPVHDLVTAAAAGDPGAAAQAAAALDRFGSSSGADVAYGLRLAFTRR
jgi:Protein of unknown function (DUF2877)